jgi:hypothetical protein
MTPTATADDFDDIGAMRREIQRLNEKIDKMHDDHVSQIERYKTDRDEMAKYIVSHPAANNDKALEAAYRVVAWSRNLK